jgi:hypothetical protein
MLLMSDVIERLKAIRPDLLIETVGGYGPVTDPPEDAQIHPAQRVVWAHWGRGYTSGYDDPRYGRKDNLEKWRRAARGGVTICQYYTDNFAEPWVMSPFTVAMEGDRRYFQQKGIDSVYMLMWPRGYWWNHSLNGYLAGKCFYDFSLNPYAVLEDYAQQYYGPNAGPLLAKYFEAWARNPELCYRVRGDSRERDRAMACAGRQCSSRRPGAGASRRQSREVAHAGGAIDGGSPAARADPEAAGQRGFGKGQGDAWGRDEGYG